MARARRLALTSIAAVALLLGSAGVAQAAPGATVRTEGGPLKVAAGRAGPASSWVPCPTAHR